MRLSKGQWTKAVKARASCERCGRTERLHAHHIDEDTSNNVLSNGECLCVWCHDDHHEQGGSIIALDEAARSHTAEHNRKIGEAAKRRFEDPAEREKIGAANRGKPSPLRGRTLSDEHKRKISAANRGHVVTDEMRRKIGAASRGKKLSAEHKRKLSAANRGRTFTHTDETRRKMSAAAKLREQRKRAAKR